MDNAAREGRTYAFERRHFKRKPIRIKAERLSGNESHGVFINNISEKGIHITHTPAGGAYIFPPNTPVDLRFQLSSGETIKLQCVVRWSHRNEPPDDETGSMGLEIIDPPERYREFVKSIL
jgi:hypothetical protein